MFSVIGPTDGSPKNGNSKLHLKSESEPVDSATALDAFDSAEFVDFVIAPSEVSVEFEGSGN